jgi:hypothetical protein
MNDKIQDESTAYFHYYSEFARDKTTSIVKETEDGELYIELSDELMERMGWAEGTALVWVVEDDRIILREEEEQL